MNAAGLNVMLHSVSTALEMPYYQSLVTDGSISQAEFDSTRKNLGALVATLKKTPLEKIEAMVAHDNDTLTAHMADFNAKEQTDYIAGFRGAQIMAGYVTTIMAKSGIRE